MFRLVLLITKNICSKCFVNIKSLFVLTVNAFRYDLKLMHKYLLVFIELMDFSHFIQSQRIINSFVANVKH